MPNDGGMYESEGPSRTRRRLERGIESFANPPNKGDLPSNGIKRIPLRPQLAARKQDPVPDNPHNQEAGHEAWSILLNHGTRHRHRHRHRHQDPSRPSLLGNRQVGLSCRGTRYLRSCTDLQSKRPDGGIDANLFQPPTPTDALRPARVRSRAHQRFRSQHQPTARSSTRTETKRNRNQALLGTRCVDPRRSSFVLG